MPKKHITSGSGTFISPELPEGVKRLVRMMSSSPEDGKVDPDVMRDYLAQASELIRDGRPLPEPLRTIIADSFSNIAGGADPARALHLKATGRRHVSLEFRRGVVAMVTNLVNEQCSLSEAFELVSKTITEPADRYLFKPYAISAEAVRKIWEKERKK